MRVDPTEKLIKPRLNIDPHCKGARLLLAVNNDHVEVYVHLHRVSACALDKAAENDRRMIERPSSNRGKILLLSVLY